MISELMATKPRNCPIKTTYCFQSEVFNHSDGSSYKTARYEFCFEVIDFTRKLYKIGFRDVFTGGQYTISNFYSVGAKKPNEGLKQMQDRLNSYLPERVTYHAQFSRPHGIIKINLKNKGASNATR